MRPRAQPLHVPDRWPFFSVGIAGEGWVCRAPLLPGERSELVRWHPDKFEARFGRRLDPGDKPRVMQRVVALSQALNALVEAAGAAGK